MNSPDSKARLTRQEVEATWAEVDRLYVQSVSNVYPAMVQRLRAPLPAEARRHGIDWDEVLQCFNDGHARSLLQLAHEASCSSSSSGLFDFRKETP